MSYQSKLIKAICQLDKEDIEISSSTLAKQMNISNDEASINITSLTNDGYLINTSTSFRDINGHIMSTRGSYKITNKSRDYKSLMIKNGILKWYPIAISTIALIISILVAIYK